MNNISYNQEYTANQANRGLLRRLFRKAYVKHTLRFTKGRTIDFGCGVGKLLERLPKGSIGLEINPYTIKHCLENGLNVKLYKPEEDKYSFEEFNPDEYKTVIMSHVLEHIENPLLVVKAILISCRRLGIERIIIIVPGSKGFNSDHTHKTFINDLFFQVNDLRSFAGFRIVKKLYFPINLHWAGKFLIHNETIFIYDKQN